MSIEWSERLSAFGRNLLFELGEDPSWLPTDHNPITRALKDEGFVDTHQDMKGFSRIALSRVATVCQMVVFDAEGGPEGDGKPKALRRHWYQWYKTKFAQPLAMQLGDYHTNGQGVPEINDIAWTQRLSQTYAYFVDTGKVTYKDLWVEDASRMMEQNWETLFSGCHIILAVEKDSLLADFLPAAKAIGARSAYSGKGKSSKAAIEKCLRDHFGWSEHSNSFTSEKPLIILYISDHDFDGEAVIGPTFAGQARRYTPHILEARVGIKPHQVTDAGHQWLDKWYQVKVVNAGYKVWANEKALFLAQCIDCPHMWPVVGIDGGACPVCGGPHTTIDITKSAPHGFEVEALKTRDYYGLVVDALLQVLPFDYIVQRLREECVASAYDAARRVADEIYANNANYQALLAEFDRLEGIKDEFERMVTDTLQDAGEPRVSDWQNDDPDPTPQEFRDYTERANGYVSPWRPFGKADRTASLAEWLRENSDLEQWENHRIDWRVG